MCPKRRQNLHLYCDRSKHTDDEQSTIHDYMVFQGVLRHCEKFSHFGESRIKPETFNLKGVTSWSFFRDAMPLSKMDMLSSYVQNLAR